MQAAAGEELTMGMTEEAIRLADDPPAYFGNSARAAHEIPALKARTA